MKYIGVSTPAWSMPHASRHPNPTDHNPTVLDASSIDRGHLLTKPSSISWTVGRQTQRDDGLSHKKTLPGPGAYELREETGNRRVAGEAKTRQADPFGRQEAEGSRSAIYRRDYVPGVGSYDVAGNSLSYQQGKSMAYKADSLMAGVSKVAPGPGSYELNNTTIEAETSLKRKRYDIRNRLLRERQLKQAEAGKDGNDKAEEQRPQSVYHIQDSFEALRKISSKKGTFSKSGMSKTTRSKGDADTPGPGFYKVKFDMIKQLMLDGKGAKLLGRFEPPKQTDQETPGPGNYQTKSAIENTKTYTMSKAKKDLSFLLNNATPGPGQYEVKSTAVHSTRCSTMPKS